MLRKIIALLSGVVVWFVFYVITILMPNFVLLLFPLSALISGFTASSIAENWKFFIGVSSVLLGYIPTAIWSFSVGPVGKNLSLGSIIASLIIGSFIVSNMAVVGAFLSKVVFDKKT